MRKLLFALAIVVSASTNAPASDLSIDDLLGRWCGKESTYTFTEEQLSVARRDGGPLKNGPVLKIVKVEATPDQIDVYWEPLGPGHFTRFELSPDKRQLHQVAETVGDKGPRRLFRRCK